jgi:hypothetical protein
MKTTAFVSIVTAISCLISSVAAQQQNEDSPFHWPDNQNIISPFAKSGKMEQLGRTGVAAMHATLLK